MFLFLRNFLSNRTIQVKAHDAVSKPYLTENGIPQGSVISVTMFVISINDIFRKIPNPTNILCLLTTATYTVMEITK